MCKGIRVEFKEPQREQWSGVVCARSCEFTPDGCSTHPGPGHWIRWGSWKMNFWFTAASGTSWRVATANALRRLRHLCKPEATYTIFDINREEASDMSTRSLQCQKPPLRAIRSPNKSP